MDKKLNKISIYLLSMLYVLCSSVFIGCATPEDVGRMQWEVNELKSEIKKIKKGAPVTAGQEVPDKQLAALQEAQESTSRTVSDLLIKVQDLTTEFQMLTGRFEETRYFSEKSSSELTESRDMLAAKVAELEAAVAELKKNMSAAKVEQPLANEGKKDESAGEAKKEDIKEPQAAPTKEDQLNLRVKDVYMEAYQAFKEGKTEEAREKFMSVIDDFSENEYSDNARFWIGETYYKDENYEDAILAYEELFKKNPDSDKVPGAMLKQGLAFYALMDKKTGQLILEKLIEKFPDSEQAKLAMKKINKSVPPKKKN